MLERIRLTVINNLLKYHPESSEKLAMGEFFGIKPPEKKASIVHVLILGFWMLYCIFSATMCEFS
jgi:hypothetical protein